MRDIQHPPIQSADTPSRFDWVLAGHRRGPDEVFDIDLAEHPAAAVIPTRGALVPEWLLVVPRTRCLSVACMGASDRGRIGAVAMTTLARVAERTLNAIIFEHGAGFQGSVMGCGVDQAHLHVVGDLHLVLDAMRDRVREVEWRAADPSDPWAEVPDGREYLMVRDATRAMVSLVERPSSQRLRRAVAEILRVEGEWDYRQHPHAANARLTKEMFGSAGDDAGS